MLDLTMVYYHIILTEDAIIICKTILSWVKYHCKCLTMVVANLPDIFKQKTNDLFQVFEFICPNLYDLLILPKVYCTVQVY